MNFRPLFSKIRAFAMLHSPKWHLSIDNKKFHVSKGAQRAGIARSKGLN